ncbi:MAG: GrpB family protein [Bacilli bacterium]|jgi:GrpB-like predicted nucleotidyltransferase (UPF0157 family)|nr:GrpB family protein [Bacilli bacterium]HHU23696.1 hypothetical protein [Acholeplasmataceae bacterium]
MRKIEVVDYSSEWKKQFEQIKTFLGSYFPEYEMVHVGSTAIEKASAKPIIDIDMVIPDLNLLPEINNKLAQIGFRFRGDLTIEGRYAYYCDNAELPPCHFYVCLDDGQGYVEHMVLKKHLLKHHEQVKKYSKLKKKLAHKYPYDIEKYIDGKTSFIMAAMKKEGYHRPQYRVVRPDFSHSLLNVVSSVQHHFNSVSPFSTLPSVDKALKGAKHVVLMVLDGLGKNILEYHLTKKHFIRQKVIDYVTSIYPSTTVAATTALRTGKTPGETGWIGWYQYFNQFDQYIVMFQSLNYFDNKKVDVPYLKEVPITPFHQEFSGVKTQELYPAFMPGGCHSLKEMMDRIVNITNTSNQATFTYAYWDYPDSSIHFEGCCSDTVKACLIDINEQAKYLAKHLNEDTVVLIVADHGLVDIKTLYINKFPEITKYFVHKPTLESRFTAFYVNDPIGFEETFTRYFSSYFELYKTEDLAKLGLLGNVSPKSQEFLGDFIAIAKHKYAFSAIDEPMLFKATHAGGLEEEMMVPVIVVKSVKKKKE